MVQVWRTEVERPWVGMTDEAMTEVERARAELACAVGAIEERVSIRRRIAFVRRHRRAELLSAFVAVVGMVTFVALSARRRAE